MMKIALPAGTVRRLALSAAVAVMVAAPLPAAAMDWLNTHLESQRANNLRNHQLRMQTQRSRPPAARAITPQQRQAAWTRHKAEYQHRAMRHGVPTANAWLDRQILAGR